VRLCPPQIPHGLAGTVRTSCLSRDFAQRFGTAVPYQARVYSLLNALLLHAGVMKVHWLNLWLRQIKLKVTGNEQNQMLQNICDFSGMHFYRA